MAENNNTDSEFEESTFTPAERKEWEEAQRVVNEDLRKAQEGRGEAEKASPVVFECRICGSSEYITHTADSSLHGLGDDGSIVGYECAECSVTFSNLAKFSARM